MRAKQFLLELGDKPYVLPKRWVEGSKSIILPSGKELDIKINRVDDIAIINFYVDSSQQLTGGGDAIKIFSTVGSAIIDYVNKRKPRLLVFTGNASDASRIKLYDRMVKRWEEHPVLKAYEDITNLPQVWPDDLDWILDEFQDITGQKIYVLERI